MYYLLSRTSDQHFVICARPQHNSQKYALSLSSEKYADGNLLSFLLLDTTHCHLWMFLFDILLDSNKSNVATWEDQKGMFRIRDPTRLAEMWGEKRNRTNMTYEKLSRSLRHYYEKKILRKVPKRKYTYKFNSREILKSYEVQPFYRRSTSNSQAQRNAAAAAAAQQQAASQAQLATVYQTSPTSGQCSPYTPGVTPSPSYHQHHAGFNWNQMPAFPQAWPIAVENPHQSHYQVPTSMAGKQWHLPMQQVYHQSVDQGLIHSPVTQPLAPQYHHMSSAVMPTSQTYQGAESRAAQYMTDMQTAGSPASVPADEKPNLDLIIDNFSSSKTKRSHSLPAITPPSPTFAASNALFNQNNSNSNQNRCRPNSVNSYESSSPDSIYSNDAMFNDIMESLVMEAF